jgi:hypothetical protein
MVGAVEATAWTEALITPATLNTTQSTKDILSTPMAIPLR